jgi:hypothetical protein
MPLTACCGLILSALLVANRRKALQAGTVEGTTEPPRYAYWAGPAIAAAMLVVTIAWGSAYGLGLRDPDGIIGWRFSFVLMLVGGFVALDVVPRAIAAARSNGTPTWATLVALARERWPWRRIGFVVGAIVAFYVTYLCYRNVKSYLPLARPEMVDSDLANFERGVFGTDPSTLLHQLLGSGVSAQVLSTIYLLFLTFVPISVGVALVWSTDRAGGLWWVSVLSLNWVLGVASYFLLPSMGPAFVEPHLFTGLPDTGTSSLQGALMEDRRAFVADPVGSGQLQSIAAFASLHVSIVFAGALVAHMLRAPRTLRIALWVYLGLTFAATIYFGWHYVVDDIAGFAIGFASVYLGAVMTGWRIERSGAASRLQLESA